MPINYHSKSETEIHLGSFPVDAVIERIAHWLPSQGPLKDFIHHNTLHAFQDRPFHEGLAVAEELYGARNYLELSRYQQLYEEGAISEDAVKRAIESHTKDPKEQALLGKQLFKVEASGEQPLRPKQRAGIRSAWLNTWHVDLDEAVHPLLFRLLGNFLDQGIAIWRMPHAHASFWEAIGKIMVDSALPIPQLNQPFSRELLRGRPEAAIGECLKRLVGSEPHYAAYLLEMVLAHPGWSGMVSMIEQNPTSLIQERIVSLKELIAIELLLECAVLARELGDNFAPLTPTAPPPPWPDERPIALSSRQIVLKIWQEAWEWTFYEDTLKSLRWNAKRPKVKTSQPQVQAFFCIDDRECSLRRHIEEIDPSVKTWAVAGFFGVDFLFQGAHDTRPTKLCPAPVKPEHIVRESPSNSEEPEHVNLLQHLHLAPANTLFRGWLLTQVMGLWHSIRLALLVFKPSLSRPTDQLLSRIEPKGRLNILRVSEQRTKEGYLEGYSIGEMADRVQAVLTSAGCIKNFWVPERICG